MVGATALYITYKRIAKDAYYGRWHRPEVQEGEFIGVKHFFYREFRTSLATVHVPILAFIFECFMNPGINPQQTKKFPLKHRYWSFAFDDVTKLQN